ncbi:MAG: DUF1249 domain-containing protein [Pseudomonadota bacterium]
MSRIKKRYTVNFPKYLSICEFNYHRLMRLLPQHEERQQWRYLLGEGYGEMAIVIELKESAKYTTTVHIIVYTRLQKPMAWVRKQYKRALNRSSYVRPKDKSKRSNIIHNSTNHYSIDVRLYHDATLAEVIAWQGQRRFQPRHEYPNPQMYQRDEKAQLNTFLGELLSFCLEKGRIMENVLTIN